VEGCEPSYKHIANEKGLSIDKTSDIIKNYPDKDKKIEYIPIGFTENQWELRNEVLKYVDKDTDILFLPDGDEIYNPEELRESFKFLQENKGYFGLKFNHILFTDDLKHIKYDNTPDCMFCARVYHYDKEISFSKENPVIPFPSNKYKHPFNLFNVANVYHCGWVRSKQRLMDKTLWTIKRHIHRQSGYLQLTGKTDEELMNWIRANVSPFANRPCTIYNFVGKYPDALIQYMNDKGL
jgi:hypothetical protein